MSMIQTTRSSSKGSVTSLALEYWNTLPKHNDLPLRESFDPVHIPLLLPYVILLEVFQEPLDFRFRVIGSHCRAHFFDNHTGRMMSSLSHITTDGELFTALRTVIDERRPMLNNVTYVGPKQNFRKNAEAMLPLCDRDGRITHILVFLQFDTVPTLRVPEPV